MLPAQGITRSRNGWPTFSGVSTPGSPKIAAAMAGTSRIGTFFAGLSSSILLGTSIHADNPSIEIIHRGKYKPLTALQRKWLKRRQAIEPLIGHTKADHDMQRCWLKGALGDALHALSCAAG